MDPMLHGTSKRKWVMDKRLWRSRIFEVEFRIPSLLYCVVANTKYVDACCLSFLFESPRTRNPPTTRLRITQATKIHVDWTDLGIPALWTRHSQKVFRHATHSLGHSNLFIFLLISGEFQPLIRHNNYMINLQLYKYTSNH